MIGDNFPARILRVVGTGDDTVSPTVLAALCIYPFVCHALGLSLHRRISSLFSCNPRSGSVKALHGEDVFSPYFLVFGIQAFTFLSFALRCTGASWIPSLITPLILVGPVDFYRTVKSTFTRSIFHLLHPNFVVYMMVIVYIGTTLFYVEGNTLRTAWMNSYADFPFHSGMISSFLSSDNFPPQYQILPGNKLTYPFFTNFWTAQFLSVDRVNNWYNWATVIAFQWVLIWALIYYFLNGNKYVVLPWALLFGGGTYYTIDKYSETVLHGEYPWAVFMTTIWAPQRTAAPGIAFCLAAVSLCLKFVNDQEDPKETTSSTNLFDPQVILCGLILGLAPLWHAHTSLFSMLFVGFVLLGLLVRHFGVGATAGHVRFRSTLSSLSAMVSLVVSVLPVVASLPWLLSNRTSNIISLMYGWSHVSDDTRAPAKAIEDSLMMWKLNGLPWLSTMVVFWVVARKHLQMTVLFMLFLLANVLRLAPWQWDQFKVFIALYAIFLCVWAHYRSPRRYFWLVHLVCIALLIPGMIEVNKVLSRPNDYHNNVVIFDNQDLQIARDVADYTPPGSIILSKDRHNSPISISGRYLFMGYEGWLWSHGLEFSDHKKVIESGLGRLADTCSETAIAQYCPDYLLWTSAERELFHTSTPGTAFKKVTEYLFEVPKNANKNVHL